MEIRNYESGDERGLVALWSACNLLNPKNDPVKDIRRKLDSGNGWLLVGVENGTVVASVMAGYEGHRGWINYLAVSPDLRRRGYGERILKAAEANLKRAGCPKINLQVRRSNREVIGFYGKMGYLDDEVISLGKRLIDDSL